MTLPLTILLTTAAVAASFFLKRWWFPAPINSHAALFDSLFSANLLLIGAAFLAAQIALAFLIFRHRDRGQPAVYSAGSLRLEFLWTALTLLLFLGAGIASTPLWTSLHFSTLASAPLQIEVAAKQFAWSFRYPGPDSQFAKSHINLINDATGNPFGIADNDPAGRDDIVSSALRIPAGQPVQLLLRSRDVIHNFFVRELRIKQDLVPGMDIPFRFQADVPGQYEIACSELCGLGHHQMRSVLIVMPPAEFSAWLAAQSKKQ